MGAADAYMLDTNVFNRVRERKISLAPTPLRRLVVIGVQAAELKATKDLKARAALLAAFEEVNPELTFASSFSWDIEGAGFGQACWNDGSGFLSGPSRKSPGQQWPGRSSFSRYFHNSRYRLRGLKPSKQAPQASRKFARGCVLTVSGRAVPDSIAQAIRRADFRPLR